MQWVFNYMSVLFWVSFKLIYLMGASLRFGSWMSIRSPQPLFTIAICRCIHIILINCLIDTISNLVCESTNSILFHSSLQKCSSSMTLGGNHLLLLLLLLLLKPFHWWLGFGLWVVIGLEGKVIFFIFHCLPSGFQSFLWFPESWLRAEKIPTARCCHHHASSCSLGVWFLHRTLIALGTLPKKFYLTHFVTWERTSL